MADTKDNSYELPYPVLPLDVENAPLRAADFAHQNAMSALLLTQIQSLSQLEAMSKKAFAEDDVKKAAGYVTYITEIEASLENPKVYTSVIAGDC